MDYPIKYLFLTNNVVTGGGFSYYPNNVLEGPPGTVTVTVPGDSPITDGWRREFDDEAQKWNWYPPRPAAASTNSVPDEENPDAGNGNPPPKGSGG